ncbi:MAG: 8-amino-7-oxononanoate synthase [Pirellulaceae bacterium]|nr:8-amino-7-oxononanoate synthase [Pirellulaceae bacterium]
MFDPLDWLNDALADLDRRGLRRKLASRASPQRGDRIEIDGQTLVNFGSNDYLGLASDPRIVAAARDALAQYGWGSGASPLVTGRSNLHAELERKLAEFEGAEAALLFPSGYAANVGTIAALAGKGDAIYSDELNHASIIDGCRLSGAAVHVYRHGDVQHLEQLLQAERGFRRRLIVSDSLFSMHGDKAPLTRLAELAEKSRAMLLVDEAHATGVFGRHGRGLCEEYEIEQRVAVRIGTVSKALGSHGGFVSGSRQLIDWLANRARSFVFSTAAPDAVAAAGLAALQVVADEPERRVQLLAKAERLKQRLNERGLPLGDSRGQILPVMLGDASRTMAASALLRERGLFVPGIRPPSVPEGQSLLRISLSYLHTDEQLESLANALGEIRVA